MHSQGEPVDPLPSKYSLRQRFARLPPKDRSRLTPSTRHAPSEDAPSFNCIDTAQQVLDFNRATSVNLIQTTLPLTLPFDPTARTPPLPSKHSMSSSFHEETPSHANSHKTTSSHKTAPTHQQTSDHRLLTEQSQPNQLSSHRENRNKYSLRQPMRLQKQELLVSLRYSDLGPTIHIPAQSTSPFSRLFCATLKKQGGCPCQPKCFWIDRWLTAADPELPAPQPQSEQQWDQSIKQIEKDLPRTQPNQVFFHSSQALSTLREVLIGYCRVDPEISYVQGLNFIAACLVYHARTAYEALRAMDLLLRRYNFRTAYLADFEVSRRAGRQLETDLRRLAYDLHCHLVSEGVELHLFATSWYFSLLGSFVPLSSLHLVVDKFLRRQWAGLNEVLLTLLLLMREELLQLGDSQLMLAFSNQRLAMRAARIDWQELVLRSDHLRLAPL